MLDKIVIDIASRNTAWEVNWLRVPALEIFVGCLFDGKKSGVAADRAAFFPHHLQAVVFGWIVAGGDHDAAVIVVKCGGKVHHFCADHAQIDNITSACIKAFRKSFSQFWAAQPNVVAHADSLCARFGSISSSDRFCNFRIQFAGNFASDIIRFEAGQVFTHIKFKGTPLGSEFAFLLGSLLAHLIRSHSLGKAMKYAGLLRGINVGGRKLLMADLKKFLLELGFENPATLLQSGNCVFESDKSDPAKIEEFLEAQSVEKLGMKIVWYVRTEKQIADAIAENPFPEMAADDPSHLVLHFCKEPMTQVQIDELKWSGPEEMKVVGDVLYASFPDGIGTSELFKNKDWNRLNKLATARNWTTVNKLLAMMSD